MCMAMLPKDFPKWKTVYHYFRAWRSSVQVTFDLQADLFRTSSNMDMSNMDITQSSYKKETSGHKENKKIFSLQILRGLAAVLVVHNHAIHHTINFKEDSFQKDFFFLEHIGAVGVDIFFVISGFIITITSSNYVRNHGAKDFLIKRLIRIMPVFYLLSLLEIIFRVTGIKGGNLSWATTVKTIILLPIFDHGKYVFPFISAGWSLSFEFYFYLIIALSLFLFKKSFIISSCSFMIGLIGLGFFTHDIKSQLFKFITNPIAIEFILGCIIAKIYQSTFNPSKKFSLAVAILGVTGILLTLFLGCDDIDKAEYILDGDNSLKRLFLWGIPSALLVYGFISFEASRWSEQRSFASLIALLIGDASYSIYLIHGFSLHLINKIWTVFHLSLPDVYIILGTLVSVLIGIVFYILCEKRLTQLLNRRYTKFCLERSTLEK